MYAGLFEGWELVFQLFRVFVFSQNNSGSTNTKKKMEELTVQTPPSALQEPLGGSGGGCRQPRSSGKSGMRVTVLESAASGFCSSHACFASSKRAILSGVNCFHKKSGGLGNVENICVWGCSAILSDSWCCCFSAGLAQRRSRVQKDRGNQVKR